MALCLSALLLACATASPTGEAAPCPGPASDDRFLFAAADETIVLLDREEGRLLRLDPSSDTWESVFEYYRHIEGPLATSDASMFVGRPAAGDVIEIPFDDKDARRSVFSGCVDQLSATRVGLVIATPQGSLRVARGRDALLGPEVEHPVGARLAGWDQDVALLDPDTGRVDLRSIRSAALNTLAVGRRSNLISEAGNLQRAISDRTLPFPEPPLGKVVELAMSRGVLYLLVEDPPGFEVVAVPLASTVPIRTGIRAEFHARLMVTRESLVLGDPTQGSVVRRPRPIPVEIQVGLEEADAVLGEVVSGFADRGLLGERTVTWEDSLEASLRRVGLVVEETTPSLRSDVCRRSPQGCEGGTALIVPALSPERNLEFSTVELDGSATLADVVARRVHSPEFNVYTSALAIAKSNGGGSARALVEQRKGSFLAPEETLRFYVAAPESQILEILSPLPKSHSTVRITPLDRTGSKLSISAWVRPECTDKESPENACKLKLQNSFERAKQIIHHAAPPGAGLVPDIGVAEKSDAYCAHPDFKVENFGACNPLPGSTPSAAPSANDWKQEVRVRDAEAQGIAKDEDHAIMVASLIGARSTLFDTKGLSPRSQLVPIAGVLPDFVLDVERAFDDRDVSIFNVSLSFDTNDGLSILQMRRLEHMIDQKDALFVVAAGNAKGGNDGLRICAPGGPDSYPGCFADKPNVIVVAAATDGGTRLRKDSHWSPDMVHVAAPGEGFALSARNREYVPAEGTSFAAPMVTGVAAHLWRLGITDPAAIKRRIVSTSDPNGQLAGRVLGGLLNAERATTRPSHARLDNVDGEIVYAEVDPAEGDAEFRHEGERVYVRKTDILRLTFEGSDTYRIAYLLGGKYYDRSGVEPVNRPWEIEYREVSEHGVGVVKRRDLLSLQDYIGPAK